MSGQLATRAGARHRGVQGRWCWAPVRRAAVCGACLWLALGAALVRAESSCWPEAKTLGRNASALLSWRYTGASYTVPTFDARGRPTPAVDCQQLVHAVGVCGVDVALSPIDAHPRVPGLARLHTVAGAAPVWVRAAQWGTVAPILAVGRQGRQVPAAAVWRVAPSVMAGMATVPPVAARASGRFVQRLQRHIHPADAQRMGIAAGTAEAYAVAPWVRAVARVRNADGEWFRVTERLAASADMGGTHRFGPVQRTGYVLHRDARGVVRAVIEDDYCD